MNQLCINNIRVLCSEMIDRAKSGHPGMAIGSTPIMHTLYTKILKATPSNPEWINRDYFVLSGGHASSLLYTTLHLSGYDISMEDLKAFRSLGSITPGHPELGVTPGVDATTGPLGQGVGEAVGIALAEEYLRSKTNGLIDHYTYALCGDGDIQEGISQEAFSIAGFLNLSKLIVIYDSNDVQLDGDVNKCFNENNKLKFESLGWHYQIVSDGNDCDAIEKACKKIGSWRLEDCDMYVTLEPCSMCSGAIIQSRIKNLYFGAFAPKTGACGSVLNLFEHNFNHKVNVVSGIMEEECSKLLKDFFKKKR